MPPYEDCMSDNEIPETLLAEPLVESEREPDAVPDRAARARTQPRYALDRTAARVPEHQGER
jgi:hypothetical protein